MNECLPEVCVCLRHLFVLILNYQEVQGERLRLCVAQPGSERTDVGLELFQVLCHVVVVTTHFAKQTCHLFQGRRHGAFYVGDRRQLCGNVVEIGGLLDHVDHGVGHDTGETVVTDFVRAGSGQLQDVQVVLVDRVQRFLNPSYDVAHGSERNLKAQGVNHTLFKVEGKVGLAVGQIT